MWISLGIWQSLLLWSKGVTVTATGSEARTLALRGDVKLRPKEKITHQIKLTIPAIFFTIAALSFYSGKTPIDVLVFYVVISLVAFTLYAIDKSAAINGRWRISENKLHLVSLLGGWPGAMVAQQTLRHKSVKQKFLFVFWVTVIVNSAAFSWIHTVDGARVLHLWLGGFHHLIDPVVQRLVS